MRNKRYLKTTLFLIIFIAFIFIIYIFINFNKNNESISSFETHDFPVYYTQMSYLNDTSTPELAIADAPYAFIAKINSINRTDYKNPVEVELTADGSETMTIYDPYTIYNITVIENIKGNLIKNTEIELEQMGGLNNYEESYTFPEDTGFLTVGDYYILIAYAPFENDTIQINSSTSIVHLGKIENNATINLFSNIINNTNTTVKNEATNFYTANTNTVEKEAINKVVEYKNASLSNSVQETLENNTYNKSKYDIYYMNN